MKHHGPDHHLGAPALSDRDEQAVGITLRTGSLARLPVPRVAGRLTGDGLCCHDGRTVPLDARTARVAALFDGRRTFDPLCRAAQSEPGELGPDDVAAAIVRCDELDLLAEPGAALETLPVASLYVTAWV